MSTRPCPQCGNVVSADARFCGQCGKTIEPTGLGKTMIDPTPFGSTAEEKPAAKTLMQTMADPMATERARTMLDAALDKDPHTEDTAKKPAVSMSKTMMLGAEAPAAPAAAPPQTRSDASPLSASIMTPGSVAPAPADPVPTPASSGMKTMLGMPAKELPSSSPVAAAHPAMESAPHSQQLPPAHKTMLGVAIPGIAPTRNAPSSDPHQQGAPIGNVNKPQGTLLGVAIPGIAPSHAPVQPPPGGGGTNVGFPAAQPQVQPARVATMALPAAPPPILPAPAPLVDEPLPEAPRLPEKKGVPIMAVVGIVFLIVLLAGGVAAFVVLRGGSTLAASPQLDESGRESLKIRCESCPDGTVVALGASSAQVAASAAVLPLPAPLKIGENDLDVQIDRPASGRDETVRIHVPVAYRVRADMATLAAKPPAITVRVEATNGSDVTVEGKPVALDATGRGSYALDLSKDVEGTSDEQKTIERKIAFAITPKGGKPESGSLTARAAIVPLHLDSPGAVLYTDRATAAVSGQTKAGGAVTIDGQTAPIDAQGRFGARVELKEIGEKGLAIVASSPPLAPRIVHAKAIRVASLDATAKELESKGPLAYDAFATDPASKVGQAVAVDGEVVESRAQQGYTVMLVDAKKGCAATRTQTGGACLVRIVHGEEMKTARGDTVRAYGLLEGAVAAGGKQVPDIGASLLIVKGAGTK